MDAGQDRQCQSWPDPVNGDESLEDLLFVLLHESEEGDVVLTDCGMNEKKNLLSHGRKPGKCLMRDQDLIADPIDLNDEIFLRPKNEEPVQARDHVSASFNL